MRGNPICRASAIPRSNPARPTSLFKSAQFCLVHRLAGRRAKFPHTVDGMVTCPRFPHGDFTTQPAAVGDASRWCQVYLFENAAFIKNLPQFDLLGCAPVAGSIRLRWSVFFGLENGHCLCNILSV